MTVVERLRSGLEEAGGKRPRFTWFLRMDPQVRQLFGGADFIVDTFHDQIRQLQTNGDVFGLHVHSLRWCKSRDAWIHDFADQGWLRHCVESSFEAFWDAFGYPSVRHRFGSGYLSDEIVSLIDELGTRVDLTMEAGLSASMLRPPTPVVGTFPDYRRVPRAPYRPSRRNFRRADHCRERGIVLVPLSTMGRRPEKTWWWNTVREVRRGFHPSAQPLHLWRAWPSPQQYWDLVADHLASMRDPYLALAIRTDSPGSDSLAQVGANLDHLRQHPLIKRLDFIDPLDAVSHVAAP
jgi:hypothetical protein